MSDPRDIGYVIPERDEEYARLHDPDKPEREEAERKEAERLAAERKKLLTAMLQDSRIRAWLWEILAEFDAFRTRFGITPGGMPDPQGSWYRAGMRDAGWWLWTQLDDAAPELASLMRREHNPGNTIV